MTTPNPSSVRLGDTTHECPREGCPRRVPSFQLACKRHWFTVSPATRRWVNAAYRGGTADEHRHAMAAAIREMNLGPA